MIIFNSFVRRQKVDSHFTHWIISDEELIERVNNALSAKKFSPGYRKGVLVVHIEPQGFFSGLVTLQAGDELVGTFSPREPGEFPRKSIKKRNSGNEGKQAAKFVDIILYSSATLAEDNSNELEPQDGNWEIISVNGRPTEDEAPIDPITLMYNHFHVPFSNDGGSSTGMSDEEFVNLLRKSHEYWKDKAYLQI